MADKDYHARLVIYDLDVMPKREKEALVDWLYEKAVEMENCEPNAYSKRYTSRLMKKGK